MLALFVFLLGQTPVIDSKYLTVRPSASGEVSPGARITLTLDVSPKPKIYVYAPGQPDYIPISLTLEADPAYRRVGDVRYPKPEVLFFKPLNQRFKVYSKPFLISQDVVLSDEARASAADAPIVVKGKISYQACDDAVCYLPVDVRVTWTVRLTSQK
jgi:DsbC/DsbD-like thiol-disulfide interchange protein